MYSFVNKFLFVFIVCLGLNACSGHETVQLTLIIENARGPAGLDLSQLPSIQQVTSFLVTVTGEDLEEPVVMNLDASTASTDLNDVPVGTARTFSVEAFNSEGMCVRRNEISGVTVTKEATEPIVVSLNTVPLITNLRNGNKVISTRLRINGVGEPGGSLEFIDIPEETQIESLLFDVALGDDVISPSMSLGTFNFNPPTLAIGDHTFTVRDLDTGEKSDVTVRLIPAGSLPGTGIVSFGAINASSVSSGGIPWSNFDTNLAHLPDIMTRSLL